MRVPSTVTYPWPLLRARRSPCSRVGACSQSRRVVSRTHVPGGGGADTESGREVGERFAFAQVDQHEQGLAREEVVVSNPATLT